MIKGVAQPTPLDLDLAVQPAPVQAPPGAEQSAPPWVSSRGAGQSAPSMDVALLVSGGEVTGPVKKYSKEEGLKYRDLE